jgi:glutamate-1-semialdehyde 2,1-aminomutase
LPSAPLSVTATRGGYMTSRTGKSEAAFQRAGKVLVGGVNSPVRAYRAVGGTPPVIAKGSGSTITDIDGNTYIDYVCSYGQGILGHAPEGVVTAISKAARHGMSYGAPTEGETRLGEAIAAAVPSIEKVRFVSSGTEGAMTAVRLARGASGKTKIVKCIGAYHGHADALLVSAGSGATTLGIPSSPGVPEGATGDTLLVPYNDLNATNDAFAAADDEIAGVLVEPVAANMGVVPPENGYLEGLREICDRYAALLIFDEVITGFRVGYGGAQGLFGVRPDLTILGKIIGGGLPIGAVGGSAGIMKHLVPEGEVYQAGTLSGNPVAMAAGLATLQVLQEGDFYEQLEQRSANLELALGKAIQDAGLAGGVCLNRFGSMLCCFFTPGPVTDYATATASDTEAFAVYFNAMLTAGVYLAPSQFEGMFVSAAHTESDIARTGDAAGEAFKKAAKFMEKAARGR